MTCRASATDSSASCNRVGGGFHIGRARFPFLLASERIEAAQRWKLVDVLYDQNRSLYVGSAAIWFVALLCLWRSGLVWWAVWGAAALVVLAGRVWLARSYRNRAAGASLGPEGWAARFAIGATASACLLSAAVVASLLAGNDTHVQLFAITLQFAYIGGAVSRNAPSPAVVAGQLLIAFPPFALAMLFSGQTDYCLYAALPLLAMAGFREIALFQSNVLLNALAAQAEGAAANHKLEEACNSLRRANTQLERLSLTDALTGIANRRAFDSALREEWSRAARYDACLSLLILDLDHFKAYNDRLGHPAGDDCLRTISGALNAGLLRSFDLIARIGGEEFAVLLPGTDADEAAQIAERLMMLVADAAFKHEASPLGRVSVSIGAASFRPRPGQDATALLRAADVALYRAKQDGRNCLRSFAAVMT